MRIVTNTYAYSKNCMNKFTDEGLVRTFWSRSLFPTDKRKRDNIISNTLTDLKEDSLWVEGTAALQCLQQIVQKSLLFVSSFAQI